MNRLAAERKLGCAAPYDQQSNSRRKSRERNPLRIRKPEVQPLLVEAEELDDKARSGIKRQVPTENRACGVCFADPQIEEQEN